MFNALTTAASFCRRAVARFGTMMGYVAGWGFIVTAAFTVRRARRPRAAEQP